MASKKAKTKGSARGKRKRFNGGEASTGAKENEVEVRTAGIGDNNAALALPEPDDWNHHKKSIKGWREKVTTAQSGLRNAIKLAKKAGVNMDSLNMVVGIERKNDPAATMQYFQQVDLGLSLSDETTIRITPHNTLAGDQMDLVYKRGYDDGASGRTAATDYPPESDLGKEYARGWRHGTGKNLGLSPEQVDAAEDERKAA